MGVEEILKEKREEILRIAARHGAYNIRVFGSVARGDARLDSDVDFLVDVGPNRSFFFPGGLIFDLEELLGRRVEVAEPAGLHSYIRDRVLLEAVPLRCLSSMTACTSNTSLIVSKQGSYRKDAHEQAVRCEGLSLIRPRGSGARRLTGMRCNQLSRPYYEFPPRLH